MVNPNINESTQSERSVSSDHSVINESQQHDFENEFDKPNEDEIVDKTESFDSTSRKQESLITKTKKINDNDKQKTVEMQMRINAMRELHRYQWEMVMSLLDKQASQMSQIFDIPFTSDKKQQKPFQIDEVNQTNEFSNKHNGSQNQAKVTTSFLNGFLSQENHTQVRQPNVFHSGLSESQNQAQSKIQANESSTKPRSSPDSVTDLSNNVNESLNKLNLLPNVMDQMLSCMNSALKIIDKNKIQVNQTPFQSTYASEQSLNISSHRPIQKNIGSNTNQAMQSSKSPIVQTNSSMGPPNYSIGPALMNNCSSTNQPIQSSKHSIAQANSLMVPTIFPLGPSHLNNGSSTMGPPNFSMGLPNFTMRSNAFFSPSNSPNNGLFFNY